MSVEQLSGHQNKGEGSLVKVEVLNVVHNLLFFTKTTDIHYKKN